MGPATVFVLANGWPGLGWGSFPLRLLPLSLPQVEEVLGVALLGPSAPAALAVPVRVVLLLLALRFVIFVSAHGRHLLGQEPSSFLEYLQAFRALLEFESIRALCGPESFQPGGVLFVVRSSSP